MIRRCRCSAMCGRDDLRPAVRMSVQCTGLWPPDQVSEENLWSAIIFQKSPARGVPATS